jgi:hypothetical protein
MVNWRCPETNGRYSYTMDISTTLRTRGMASSRATFSYQWAFSALTFNCDIHRLPRLTSTYSHRRALLIIRWRPLDRVTRASMAWLKSPALQLHMSLLRSVARFLALEPSLMCAHWPIGPICTVFIPSILQNGLRNRLRKVLQHSSRSLWRCWRTSRDKRAPDVVEPVRKSILYLFGLISCFHSQIFPSYSSARRTVCKNSAFARIKQKRSELKEIGLNTTS